MVRGGGIGRSGHYRGAPTTSASSRPPKTSGGLVSIHHNPLRPITPRRAAALAPYRENAAGDFCNNVVYNCRGGYADDGHGKRARSPVNLHQNFYRRGPQTMERMYPYALPEMNYYVADNHFEAGATRTSAALEVRGQPPKRAAVDPVQQQRPRDRRTGEVSSDHHLVDAKRL